MIQTAVAGARAEGKLHKLQNAANELEASFVKQLLSTMRKSAQQSHLGQQYGGDSFQQMFDDAVANSVTKRVGLGVADQVFRHSAPEVIRQELVKMAEEARLQKAKAGSESVR